MVFSFFHPIQLRETLLGFWIDQCDYSVTFCVADVVIYTAWIYKIVYNITFEPRTTTNAVCTMIIESYQSKSNRALWTLNLPILIAKQQPIVPLLSWPTTVTISTRSGALDAIIFVQLFWLLVIKMQLLWIIYAAFDDFACDTASECLSVILHGDEHSNLCKYMEVVDNMAKRNKKRKSICCFQSKVEMHQSWEQ